MGQRIATREPQNLVYKAIEDIVGVPSHSHQEPLVLACIFPDAGSV
jgi:hypothetical protein